MILGRRLKKSAKVFKMINLNSKVFRNKATLFISSAARDVVTYPTPQYYQVIIPNSFGKVAAVELAMAQVPYSFAAGSTPWLNLIIPEISACAQIFSNQAIPDLFQVIPIGTVAAGSLIVYNPNSDTSGIKRFADSFKPNIHVLTISWVDINGLPINFAGVDHILEFTFYSEY
jgi:hypothetical protein